MKFEPKTLPIRPTIIDIETAKALWIINAHYPVYKLLFNENFKPYLITVGNKSIVVEFTIVILRLTTCIIT
jgi:hypothetical protein